MHLVGDIHQPLLCTAVFSEQFPNGDKGGNDAFVRIRTSPVKLHAFWDGMLGNGTTAGAINSDGILSATDIPRWMSWISPACRAP